ncbi:MAG: hypothetical protein A4E64_00170 [Syntrophorhabdus sp. PtaU1.Bin058]|nr:MAG: hypothetical protein A4E64_00170 [Syntrophorhabdus sp. PtaU1.Bin058]
MESRIAVFRGKEIRKTIYNNEWWFAVTDVTEVLTNTVNSTDYIKKMRNRDEELSKGWGQIVTPLCHRDIRPKAIPEWIEKRMKRILPILRYARNG